jgi:hypothetical protein
MFVKFPQVISLDFHNYHYSQMAPPLPNTNATVWSCMHVLSLLLVPLFVDVINCGEAKGAVVASVLLVANVGQRSRVDQTTSSYHSNETTLVFVVRTGHTEATTFNSCLLITIINDIVVVDDDASNVFGHLLDQISPLPMLGLTVLTVFVLLSPLHFL